MLHTRRTITALALPFILTGLFGAAPFASAAEEVCDCYCETKAGATHYPAEAGTKITRSDCQKSCHKEYPGYSMAVCAVTSDQLPGQSVNCFTVDQCAQQKGTFDSKYQPPECLAGSRYCYPDKSKAAKVTLSTPIAGLTVTGDLGEYIAKVYQWMIGSATLIAIVFIMVSGLRWTLGGLNADQVSKAKKTISNAVIGLVLLLGSYLILFTVNPQLLKLQVPSFPMIRRITMISSGTSCGYLEGEWGKETYVQKNGAPDDSPFAKGQPEPKGGKPYTVEEPTHGKVCGSVAKIVKDWEGNEVSDGTCVYDFCPKQSGATARCFGAGDSSYCATCLMLDGSFLTPSSSDCAQYSTERRGVGGALLERTQCFWTRDPGVIVDSNIYLSALGLAITGSPISAITAVIAAGGASEVQARAVVGGVCAQTQFACSGKTACRDYDAIPVVTGLSTSGKMDDLNNTWFANASDLDLGQLCDEDPCGLAPPNESCQAEEGTYSLIAGQVHKFDCKNSGYWADRGELDQDGDPIE